MNQLTAMTYKLKFRVKVAAIVAPAALLIACSTSTGPGPEPTEPAATPQTPALATIVDPSMLVDSTPLPPTLEVTEATAAPIQPTRVSTTGIPAVDRVTAIILSNNLEARRSLLRLATAGCTHELGMGGPPKCEPGQEEGTPVDYFPIHGPGEGEHIRPESIDRVLDFDATALYAVYRRTKPPDARSFFPSGTYGLIFTTDQPESPVPQIIVHADTDGQIVRIDYGAWPLDSIIEREAGELLVPPPLEPLIGHGQSTATATSTPYVALEGEPTAVPLLTPTTTTADPALIADLPQPLYFLSSDPVIASTIGEGNGVWRLDPGGQQIERITPAEHNVTSFDLWPGDRRMAYGTGNGQLYAVTMDGPPRLLYEAGPEAGKTASIRSVAWSPEGERLAFTVLYDAFGIPSRSDGLWMLSLNDGTPLKLLSNRHLDPGRDNLAELRLVIDADWSPDGTALLLKLSYWEYADIAWLDPVAADPGEANLHDPPDLWSDGSWAGDSQSILLSGFNLGWFRDLGRASRASANVEQLIDGDATAMSVLQVHELPAGIAFVVSELLSDEPSQRYQLYLGQQLEDGFHYEPVGPGRVLCNSGYVWDVAWDATGNLAAVSCERGLQLVSLDGKIDLDLTPFLGSLADQEQLSVFWGPP